MVLVAIAIPMVIAIAIAIATSIAFCCEWRHGSGALPPRVAFLAAMSCGAHCRDFFVHFAPQMTDGIWQRQMQMQGLALALALAKALILILMPGQVLMEPVVGGLDQSYGFLSSPCLPSGSGKWKWKSGTIRCENAYMHAWREGATNE